LKNEYKSTVEKLTLENSNLRNQLNEVDSKKICDFYNEIESLNQSLEEARNLEMNQKSENIKIRAEHAEILSKFEKLNLEFQQLLAENEKEILKNENFNKTYLDNENIPNTAIVPNLKKDVSELKLQNENFKLEIKNLVETNFKRANTIDQLNSENKSKNDEILKLKDEILKLTDRWKKESDKVDSNYRIKSLMEEIEGYKDDIFRLDMHRGQLKNQLSSEKMLNERLRSYEKNK